MDKPRILVADDEQAAIRNLQHLLTKEGYEVTTTQSGANALKLMEESPFDLILTDLRMPRVDGMEILRHAKAHLPEAEVIVITGYATVDSAIAAMKMGAYHYITKPYKLDEVRKVVREALEKQSLRRENLELKERLAKVRGGSILTEDAAMLQLLQTAREVAQSDCSVLITGESGTGKELLARFIHSNSPRTQGPMKALNCGVFTEELLASELFGYEKGAFTGADRKRIGLIVSAQGGTLFLDEITEMSLGMQVKLLRVLQEKEVQPVGANDPIRADVRFLAATNRNIMQMVKEGSFRQDLYFRINVINLNIPPLAQRGKDIALLARYFLDRYAALMNKPVHEIAPAAMDRLLAYEYPGNVRELENLIERAVVLTRGERIEEGNLPDLGVSTFRPPTDGEIPSLEEQEKKYIAWVLGQNRSNRTQTAEILGIDRVSLWRKIKKYGLE